MTRRLSHVKIDQLDDGQWAVICTPWKEVEIVSLQNSEEDTIVVRDRLLNLVDSFWVQFDNMLLGMT